MHIGQHGHVRQHTDTSVVGQYRLRTSADWFISRAEVKTALSVRDTYFSLIPSQPCFP